MKGLLIFMVLVSVGFCIVASDTTGLSVIVAGILVAVAIEERI